MFFIFDPVGHLEHISISDSFDCSRNFNPCPSMAEKSISAMTYDTALKKVKMTNSSSFARIWVGPRKLRK